VARCSPISPAPQDDTSSSDEPLALPADARRCPGLVPELTPAYPVSGLSLPSTGRRNRRGSGAVMTGPARAAGPVIPKTAVP